MFLKFTNWHRQNAIVGYLNCIMFFPVTVIRSSLNLWNRNRTAFLFDFTTDWRKLTYLEISIVFVWVRPRHSIKLLWQFTVYCPTCAWQRLTDVPIVKFLLTISAQVAILHYHFLSINFWVKSLMQYVIYYDIFWHFNNKYDRSSVHIYHMPLKLC